MSDFPEKSVTNMYGSTILAVRGGHRVGVKLQRKKCYVTLEWPPKFRSGENEHSLRAERTRHGNNATIRG